MFPCYFLSSHQYMISCLWCLSGLMFSQWKLHSILFYVGLNDSVTLKGHAQVQRPVKSIFRKRNQNAKTSYWGMYIWPLILILWTFVIHNIEHISQGHTLKFFVPGIISVIVHYLSFGNVCRCSELIVGLVKLTVVVNVHVSRLQPFAKMLKRFINERSNSKYYLQPPCII